MTMTIRAVARVGAPPPSGRARRGPHGVVALLGACHPGPALAVTAIATMLAASVGRGWGIVAVGAAVASGQLAVGWSNDYLDRERDADAARGDKPIVRGEVAPRTVRRAAIVATVACVPLSLLSGPRAAGVHLVAVAAALGYNARLKATLASPLPFVIAFGALPVFVTLGAPGQPLPPAWAVVAAGSFGCGAHFINTLDDLDADRRQGIWGMPQRLGVLRSLCVGAALLGGAAAVLALAPSGAPTPVGLAISACAVALVGAAIGVARRGHLEWCWRLTIVAAIATTAMLLASGSSLT